MHDLLSHLQFSFGTVVALKPSGRIMYFIFIIPNISGKQTYLVFFSVVMEADPGLLWIIESMLVKSCAHLAFRNCSCCWEKLNCLGGVNIERSLFGLKNTFGPICQFLSCV